MSTPAWSPVTYNGTERRADQTGTTTGAATRASAGAAAGVAPAGPRGRLAYAPGLDGVRALAVTAVVIYHFGATWLPGGFLGVDTFFALSGFLITSILATEWSRDGRINIRLFYLRRARRLLPALFTMLAVVSLVAAITARSQLQRLRGDVIAALTYCTNWTQILWNRSYFAQLGPPSLLQHLWSLAVEEQFYLIWPILLVICLAIGRRPLALIVAAALATGSTLLMAALFHVGDDPSRVYYGTDTHAAPMLLGATMALLAANRSGAAQPRRGRPAWLPVVTRWCADLGALAGLAVLAYGATELNFYSSSLYRGGFAAMGLAACAVINAARRTDTFTARALGVPLLRWIGQRSYGIYLWHWPILMLTRPRVDVPLHGPALIVLHVAAILVVSAVSYSLVEVPIRTRGLRAVLSASAVSRVGSRHSARASQPTHTRRGSARGGAPRPGAIGPGAFRPVAIGATMAAIVLLVAGVLVSAPGGASTSIQVDHHSQLSITLAAAPSAPRPSITTAAPTAPATAATTATTTAAPPPPPPFPAPVRVSFFGDSQGMTLIINKPTGLDGSISVTDSTVSGCGVLLGTIKSRVGYTRNLTGDCGKWPQIWATNVAKNKPQVAIVEIGAWDVFDDTVNGVTLPFGSPAWDAYFTAQLNQGLSILEAAGAQVALMGVPCYRPIAAGGLPLLPERGDDTRTQHVTSLLEAAAALHPGRVFMISPPQQFCTDPAISTNTAYRWDGVHYYKPGSALVFQTITPQLLAIPQAPPIN